MQARMISPALLLPNATESIQGLYKAISSGGVPQRTLDLVHLRASQINGCSACVHGGTTSATRTGENTGRLIAVSAWYESPLFDEAERAALALTEAATRLSDRPGSVTDEIWADARKHYDEKQLSAIVLMIALTNFFNRINTTIRTPAGSSWD